MIYDFKCEKCGAVFEANVPYYMANKKYECQCGGVAIRVFTPTPVSYWGDGWTKQRKFGVDDNFNLK
jgi:putative FmdB family regulatory protein